MQPRVIVSTDIGGNDKDDAQSLIHALLYADKVDYRGFIATSSDADNIDGITPMNQIIDAYAQDLPNLSQAGDYPDAGELRDLITQGATEGDWPGPLSDGAKLIIEEAKNASPDDPLYLLTWGPVHDVARALYEAPEIVENVRVYSVYGYGQDSKNPAAFNWMKSAVANNPAYEDLWWIDAAETFRGMYVGSSGQNNPRLNLDWVKDNVAGQGALGELFYSDFTYDLYGSGSVDGLKMGDTPSLLYLLDAVSNDDPTLSSWGGSFRPSGLGTNTWVDSYGESLGQYDGARTVYEHRDEVWDEFAVLLDIAENGVPGGGNATPTNVPAPEPAEPEVVDTPEIQEGPAQQPVVTAPVEVPTPVEVVVEEAPTVETPEPTPVEEETEALVEALFDIVGVPTEDPVETVTEEAEVIVTEFAEDLAESETVQPDPVVAGPAQQSVALDHDDLPDFAETGSAGSDRMRGQRDVESYTGAGGDDVVLGRGGKDILAGGSGDDYVKGGKGDDRLIYIADDNIGDSDEYLGGRGVDTLEIYVSAEVYGSDAFAQDLANFRNFAEDNHNVNRTGGAHYDFESFDLRVKSVEDVEVYLFDVG